jgi:pyruvate kinase
MLIEAGVDVFRLNMAHGIQEEHEETVAEIRRISGKTRPVAILVDLAGPKIRLEELANDPTDCELGAEFRFVSGEAPRGPNELTSNYDRLTDELEVGNPIMLADGTVGMVVVEKEANAVSCRVTSAGTIRSRQGINVPGVKLSLPTITDRDHDHARWAAGQQVDFISLSFVRSANDIRQLIELLQGWGSDIPIVAKIEKREALDDLNAIVDESGAVMVARGDLGVEIDVAEMPVAQKRIIEVCNRRQKPVIVATQMLDSMQRSRRPTRAESTDVANAILDGADACMLSGETAVGQYPRECVTTMNEIMLATERLLRDRMPERSAFHGPAYVHPITYSVVYGAAQIARQLQARLVVIVTHSGATALAKSCQRDFTTTVAVSDNAHSLRRLCLLWGITPLPNAPCGDQGQLREFIDKWGREEGTLTSGDRVVIVTGSGVVHGAHNVVEVHEVP